jgi:hypothetical protein
MDAESHACGLQVTLGQSRSKGVVSASPGA